MWLSCLEVSVIDEELRCSLHKRLDELLDKRSALEPDKPLNTLGQLLTHHSSLAATGPAARPLVYEVAELARDVIGDDLREAALGSVSEEQKRPREILRGWLALVLPLLRQRPNLGVLPGHLTIYGVLEALSALDAGEIQPIFKANTGKNRRANRWSIARTKLEALTWKKRLLAMGVHDKEASFRVTVAFGEQWETIRKWKPQCIEILGESLVRWELHFAGDHNDPYVHPDRFGMFGARRPSPEEGLQTAGARYQHERARSAELSRRKARGINSASVRPD
jgi:hypothetical protein